MMTACARLSEANAGLTGKVTIRSASATSWFSSPIALAAEQDADRLAGRDRLRPSPRGLGRIDHGLGLIVRPRRGRQHQRAVGDRRLHVS